MTYLTRAVGLNFEKGLFSVLPSLEIGSLPELTSRPSRTMVVAFLEMRVPSKVSRIACCRIQFLEMMLTMVELSLRTSKAVVTGARGPLVKTRTANCGRYVRANMPPTTVADTARYGPILDVNGFHNDLCDRK